MSMHIGGPLFVGGEEIVDENGKINISVDLADILDLNENELLEFDSVASAINYIGIQNAPTGANPTIYAGGEADTGLTFENSEGEEILILDAVATAVNELTFSNAAANSGPEISSTGTDTNINIEVKPKGTGYLDIQSGGVQTAAYAATSTSDGLTTGIVPDGTSYVTVTSSSANNIITLPTPTPGNMVWLNVGSNGYELRSDTPASVAINGGSGSNAESAIAANILVRCVCTSSTTWIANQFTTTGTESATEAASA